MVPLQRGSCKSPHRGNKNLIRGGKWRNSAPAALYVSVWYFYQKRVNATQCGDQSCCRTDTSYGKGKRWGGRYRTPQTWSMHRLHIWRELHLFLLISKLISPALTRTADAHRSQKGQRHWISKRWPLTILPNQRHTRPWCFLQQPRSAVKR